MNKYKIIKYKNGLGKEFYCIKVRKCLVFWEYLKFTKNVNIDFCGNLSEEAYMFDSVDRAETLINRIKREGKIDISGKVTKRL